MDFFQSNHNFVEKKNIYSLRIGRSKKNYKEKFLFNKEIYKYPYSRNFLPKINKFDSILNASKKPIKNYQSISQRTNLNSLVLKTNSKFNIIPLKNSLSFKGKIEPKLGFENIKEKFTLNKNDLNKGRETKNDTKTKRIKNYNKIRELKKIINIYYSKNNSENISNNNISNENIKKKLIKEEKRKFYGKIDKKNSMFVTEINFLNNGKKELKPKTKEIKTSKNLNYDFLSFKELLQHIKDDKKKIVNNQNDLDNMLKTTKDTYYEIWKYNHY